MFNDMDDKIISPDDLQIKDGKARFVDFKTKSRPSLYKKTNTWQHGFECKNFDAYVKAQKTAGIPGDILLLDCENRQLLQASFDELQKALDDDLERERCSLRGEGNHQAPNEKGIPCYYWNETVFTEIPVPEGITFPKPLPPAAMRTKEDIKKGLYEQRKRKRVQLKFRQSSLDLE
jgi:hypothetical protein